MYGDCGSLQRGLALRLARQAAAPERCRSERVVKGITRTYLPGPWIYLAATLVAFASPAASMILYLVIAGFYVFESSRVRRPKTAADL